VSLELHNYRIARKLLSVAYIVLGIMSLYKLFNFTIFELSDITLSITLIMSTLQAVLFTFSLIILLDKNYDTSRKLYIQLILVLLFSVLLIIGLLSGNKKLYIILFNTVVFFYIFQLLYYYLYFIKIYRTYILKNNCNHDDVESQRIKWIVTTFYMALGLGILALFVLFCNQTIYFLFIVLYSIFYIYYAIKYINYTSYFTEKPLEKIPIEDVDNKSVIYPKEVHLQALDKWLEDKKYIQHGITLDTLAAELCTNRNYLSAYINREMNCNFKKWLSNLRIDEAKKILIEQPTLPLKRIGELVGINDKASFHRQFIKNTGITPGEYRTKHLKKINGENKS